MFITCISSRNLLRGRFSIAAVRMDGWMTMDMDGCMHVCMQVCVQLWLLAKFKQNTFINVDQTLYMVKEKTLLIFKSID